MLDIKFTFNGATVIFRPTEFSLKKYYLLEISVQLKFISNMATNKNLIDYSYGDHTKLESVKNQFLKIFSIRQICLFIKYMHSTSLTVVPLLILWL